MRADLSPAIARAVEACERPTLVFDRARLDENLRAIATAARVHDITTLFAAKSFPHAEVWAMAAAHLDGFDAASAGEVVALPPVAVLSVVDPSGRGAAHARARGRLIVGCETVAQVEAAPAHAEIAIRISASLTGRDPAIGAVLDGSGHRRSRFGVDVGEGQRDELRAMADAARDRRVGIHVHHGPVTPTNAERFIATARAALDVATDAGIEPAFIDVGGSWHAITNFAAAFAALRAAFAIEIIVEPGRVIAREAGFACGRVVVARELADRAVRVVDISRSCHLRWSQVELVGAAPHPGTGRIALFVGPTCYEDDVIGEWTIAPDAARAGDRFLVRGVTGYAVAWNTGFGGVPAADVVITG